MGLNFSTQLDHRMRDYLRGRADELLNELRPQCRGQYAVAFLNRVWNEVEPRASQAPQLQHDKEPREMEQVISEGYVMQHVESRKKLKERYLVMKGSYHLEYFETKEAMQRGQKADGVVMLSGYVVLSSVTDYRDRLSQSWPQFNGMADTHWEEQHMNCPTSYPLYLWHPYRPHLLLCFHSAEVRHIWSTRLADGIRHLNTVLFRKDLFDVRAFLEAVRVYRQRKGHYGICDLYLGSETEILSNLVMEDLCPVLETQLIPHVRGAESKRKQTWLKMVGEIYAVVEAHISEGFQALLRENEEQKQQLEKKIRPDFNQILASKKQVLEKIQASLGKRVRRFCEEQVRPHLGSARDGVVNSMNAGLEETRRLFSEEVSRVINMVKNAGQGISLTEVCSQLRALPTQSVQVHRCYEKTDELERFLSKVGPRFAFSGDRFLIQRAQNIIQQLLEDAAYTFQHLLVCTKPATGLSTETCQILDNTRVRVLKKFDSDSSAAGRQFVRDTLLELFLPYVLKSLDPTCKPELPVYEASLCTDDYGVIQIDSTYRELVLHVVSEEINRAMKKPSTQPGYSLYSESMSCLWDNEPRLSIAEAPRTSPAKTTRSTSPAESTPQSSAVGPLTEHKGQAENAAASENSEMSEADEGRRWLGVREGKAGATQGEGQNGLAEWNVSHLDNDDRKESGSHEPKSPSTVREMLEALK